VSKIVFKKSYKQPLSIIHVAQKKTCLATPLTPSKNPKNLVLIQMSISVHHATKLGQTQTKNEGKNPYK